MNNKFKIFILASFSFFLFMGMGFIEKEMRFQTPQIFIEKPFVPANIIVNANREFGTLQNVWGALAQGGEEPGKRMLSPTVKHLKKIKPKFIRLDHIFDDDYYHVVRGRNADGSLNLNWSKLDETVDDILASGAKPFFALSYMPGTIASSKINPPGKWDDWQELVRKTVEHYSGQIDGVYYEVWNEPSLPMFGSWKMYGGKDYRLLYHYAVLGANQANVSYDFKIGGPSIPELDPIWISLLFDYVLENNLRLDFISWHRYSFDPAKFVSDVYEINVLLDDSRYQSFMDVEKIITEWGPNSYKDQAYSSPVAASHFLATVRKLLDKVSLAFAFEIKDGPGQDNYGWGLLTHESVGMKEKPRFYLFEWLANLEGQRLEVLGEGSQITGFAVKNDRKITAVLANYDPYTSQEEAFQFTFGNLGGGKYRFLIQELFDQPKEYEVEVKDSIVLNVNLPAYSVVKLELTKLSKVEVETETGFGEAYFNSQQDIF